MAAPLPEWRNGMFEKMVELICNYVEVEPEEVHPESRL